MLEKVVFVIVCIWMNASCATTQEIPENIIVVNLGCEDSEAYHDLIYSVEGNSKLLNDNGIKLIFQESNFCGYQFYRNDQHIINEVLTDFDLMIEIKSFFNLQNK